MIVKSNSKFFYTWLLKRPRVIGSIVVLMMLIISGTLVRLRYEIIKDNERNEMVNAISVVKQNFEDVLKNSYISALTIALTINDDGDPTDFEKIGAKVVENNKSIDAVELVPGGVIKYIYPSEANKSVINYDILKDSPDEIKYEANKSIKSKIMFFAGPSKLRQGHWGIIGRLPIYKNNKFWGFSAVIINLNTLLLHSGANTINTSKYYLQFSKKNPITKKEEFYLEGKSDFANNYSQMVKIPDGDWKLYIVLKDNDFIYRQIYYLLSLGLLLSLILGYWTFLILKKPAQLQLLIERQTEKNSKRAKEFQAIFDQAPVGIAKVDTKSGQFITVNSEFCIITGYTKEELLSTNFKSITHPDDLEVSVINQELLLKGEIDHLQAEKRYVTKLGSIVWVNLNISILFKKDGYVRNHIVIIENISNKKQAEQDLEDSFQIVSEQNKRLVNFSYIVSHNLRSHTSNIELISELLECTKSKEEQDEMVNMLKTVSKSLDDTLRNLADVVNIRTNFALKTESLNLYEYVEKAIKLLEKESRGKSGVLKNMVSTSVTINYSIAYLESILYNFISNAIRYCHPDRAPVIIIKFDSTTNALIISDNGIGIDLKLNRGNLFGMYKTFNNNPDAKGLGLFLSKNQIDALGGRIETESELGIGTTFTIYFK